MGTMIKMLLAGTAIYFGLIFKLPAEEPKQNNCGGSSSMEQWYNGVRDNAGKTLETMKQDWSNVPNNVTIGVSASLSNSYASFISGVQNIANIK